MSSFSPDFYSIQEFLEKFEWSVNSLRDHFEAGHINLAVASKRHCDSDWYIRRDLAEYDGGSEVYSSPEALPEFLYFGVDDLSQRLDFVTAQDISIDSFLCLKTGEKSYVFDSMGILEVKAKFSDLYVTAEEIARIESYRESLRAMDESMSSELVVEWLASSSAKKQSKGAEFNTHDRVDNRRLNPLYAFIYALSEALVDGFPEKVDKGVLVERALQSYYDNKVSNLSESQRSLCHQDVPTARTINKYLKRAEESDKKIFEIPN